MKPLFRSLIPLILVYILFPGGLRAQEKPFPNSQFTEIDGIRMHYRIWHPADSLAAKRILLIHGFAASTFSWRKNIDTLLASGYDVIAIDLPPFGYSDRKQGVNRSLSSQAIRCWAILDQVFPDSTLSWYIAGHSMGASVAGAMAVKNPQRVAKAVFVDGVIYDGGVAAPPILEKLAGSDLLKGLAGAIGKLLYLRNKRMEHLLTDAYAQKPDPEAVSGYLTPLKQKGTASSIVDMLVNLNEQFAFRSEQIKMPALVIWGEKDTWVPLKDGEAFFVKLPDARMHLIPGAGHCPQETHSEVVNRILIGFLEE